MTGTREGNITAAMAAASLDRESREIGDLAA